MANSKQTLIEGPDQPSDDDPSQAQGSTNKSLVARMEPAPSNAIVKGSEHAPATVEPAGQPIPLEPVPQPRRSRKLRRFAGLLVLVGALGYGAKFGHNWLVHGQFVVSTDDAYVRADTSIIAPKVSGYAVAVIVADNAKVQAGDLLVRIDPEDYEIAVAAARGKMETQDATIARIARQMEAQEAVVARHKAQLTAAEATATRAAADLERIRKLAARSFSSRKTLDSIVAERARADATVLSAQAGVLTAEANVAVLAAQREEAVRLKAEYATVLKKATRDLDHTQIRAPFDGVIGNLAVKQGQLVQPGTRLLALVPMHKIYVEANFKETHIERLKVGQEVVIEVDAYRDTPIIGRIESFSPATGAEFSLLPPENATGNFTKIVQRVPVRVSVPRDAIVEGRLRPGLSVVASVDTLDPTKPRPTLMSLLAWQWAGAAKTPAK
ncbi:MAG: HlyD family secretion protein [Methyloligellaceae bacterium]